MIVGIVIASVLLVAVLVSVWLVGRDLRRLHRTGRSITEAPSDAAGVSAAGLTAIGNNMTHS